MEQRVESQGKCHEKQDKNDEELHKSVHDAGKHHNVNSKLWKFSDEKDQSHPRQKYRQRTNGNFGRRITAFQEKEGQSAINTLVKARCIL